MKRYLLIAFALMYCVNSNAQQNRGLLKVTSNGHYLQYEDDTPFFWLGDTGWELFHRLTLEEITQYLDNRKSKGFNVIQAVILAELDGMHTPNRYGDYPLTDNNPDQPNEKYFRLVDTVVAMAAEKGIVMALLPAWGDKVTLKYGGKGPVIFNPENAYRYGKFLGARYKHADNIVWILGGDRPPQDDKDDWKPVYAAVAKGIDEGSGKHFLKTFHPGGYVWESSVYLHNEPWMDFNMIQSGHAELDQPVWKNILKDWNLKPTKPTLDGEPCYEDHPINPWPTWNPANGYFRDYEVRKQLYRSVFSGGFGVTYGHHSVWQFYNSSVEKLNYADMYWYDAIDRPAAFQAGYLRKLIESRPYLNRIPDTSLVISGQGNTNASHIEAFRDADGSYAMIYLPIGKQIEINTALIKAKRIKAWWFNPGTGKVEKTISFKATATHWVTSPSLGAKNDWVLVLDDLSKQYGAPGAK
ncbi:MAG: glycoside hydrolase family 140 protein [Chitinophagaceae bacterium]|nr:glycoside hydrolase family 140 protein [Chitinophagaceae bacterium]